MRQFQLDEINEVARDIWSLYHHERLWLFEGAMGSGKTTFIKALAAGIGFTGAVQSPTYGLVHEYALKEQNLKLIHMDLYRIKTAEEAYEAGVWDYLQGPDLCFIEWPDLIRPWLDQSALNCYLSIFDDITRTIEITKL